jgi:hypothetical protein
LGFIRGGLYAHVLVICDDVMLTQLLPALGYALAISQSSPFVSTAEAFTPVQSFYLRWFCPTVIICGSFRLMQLLSLLVPLIRFIWISLSFRLR